MGPDRSPRPSVRPSDVVLCASNNNEGPRAEPLWVMLTSAVCANMASTIVIINMISYCKDFLAGVMDGVVEKLVNLNVLLFLIWYH